MQLSTQVFALSNASQFGVSYSCYGGKKSNVPIVYTLEVNDGKIEIFFHSTVAVKNEVTMKTDNVHNKQLVGTIKAIPGSLFIDLKQDLLPNKLSNEQLKFHHEILTQKAIPYWISNAMTLVEENRIAPVWMIVSQLVKLTSYDMFTDTLDIHDLCSVKAFTPQNWYDVLSDCAKMLPNVPQFKNALRTIPVQPVEELPASEPSEPTK